MPTLLGDAHTYSLDFPAGIGFTGIAIALLGRNNPVGIAFGALLWAFLDELARPRSTSTGYEKEIVTIMQGVIVLVGRHRLRARPPRTACAASSAGSARDSPRPRRHREQKEVAA